MSIKGYPAPPDSGGLPETPLSEVHGGTGNTTGKAAMLDSTVANMIHPATDVVPLTIQANTEGGSDLLYLKRAAGTTALSVDSFGNISAPIGSILLSNGGLYIGSPFFGAGNFQAKADGSVSCDSITANAAYRNGFSEFNSLAAHSRSEMGIPLGNIGGTFSAYTDTGSVYANGYFVLRTTTGAVNGQFTGDGGVEYWGQLVGGPVYTHVLDIGSSTNVTAFTGIGAAGSYGANNTIQAVYDTSLGHTTIHIISTDNSGSKTDVDTFVAPTPGTAQVFKVDASNPASVVGSVNGVAATPITTHLPAQNVNILNYAQVTTLGPALTTGWGNISLRTR